MLTAEELENIRFCVGNDEEVDAGIFLHGICGIFALALHDRFGYPIEHVVVLEEPDDEDDEPYNDLIHIYCFSDNKFYDVRGWTDNEDLFFDEFSDWIDGNEDYLPLDSETCKEFVKEYMCETQFTELYNIALSIIDTNPERYKK